MGVPFGSFSVLLINASLSPTVFSAVGQKYLLAATRTRSSVARIKFSRNNGNLKFVGKKQNPRREPWAFFMKGTSTMNSLHPALLTSQELTDILSALRTAFNHWPSHLANRAVALENKLQPKAEDSHERIA